MKNLKKVLALVLVFASLLGLATMASATKTEDYSDAESISHIEAVDVMSTIGVFDGISGAFSPDSILTREQAAKIITYMILGKDDADALVASVAPYTDVSRDRWSAGSIAYCKNEGILAGVGNGRFEPDGKLTGVAFAKMCLVALGYDPEVEGLTGSSWAVNTSSIAIASAGITDDLSQISLADEMSREDACQMAFNTIQADMVDYEDRGSIITAGDVVISNRPSKAKPVATETKWANAADHNGISPDKIQQFAEKYFEKLSKRDTTDSFGRPATTWKYKADEIGTYVDSSKLVKSWTAKASKGEMRDAIGGSIADDLKPVPNNGSYALQYDVDVYVDGYPTTGSSVQKNDFFVKNSSAKSGNESYNGGRGGENIGKSGNGVLTELYMDDDDNVTIVMINTFLVKATADYNTVNERVNVEPMDIDTEKGVVTNFLPTYISNDDFDVTNVKEDDYLLLTVSYDDTSSKYSVESVTPATIQTATVTEYTERDEVTMGGTKYSYNQILGDNEKDEIFAINSDATLVLDTYGYIMYVDEAVSSSNFVYIDNFGSTSNMTSKPVADAYFTDGTNNEISINRVDGEDSRSTIVTYGSKEQNNGGEAKDNKTATSAHAHTHWYTYSANSSGNYTLNTPNSSRYKDPVSALTGSTNGNEVVLIKSGTVRFMSNASDYLTATDTNVSVASVKANEKTVFVVKDDDGDVDSYTGIANVPDVKLSEDHAGRAKVSWINKKSDDYASYVFVDVSGTKATVDEVSSAADYMFTLNDTDKRTHVDGLTYFKYQVVIDGKEEERWIEESLVDSGDEGKLFYSVKEDSNGRITGGREVGTKGKSRQYKAEMKIADNDEIKQSGSSLYISALTDPYNVSADVDLSDLIANSKSDINLVIGEGVDDLLYDTGADYEAHLGVSASFVGSFLDGYKLDGNVYLVVDDDDNELIETLWIFISDIDT